MKRRPLVPRLHCRICKGDHSTLFHSPYDPLDTEILTCRQKRHRSFELPDSGVGPTRPKKLSCRCRRGHFVLDRTTARKVGYECFFFDTVEGCYYLDGMRLSLEDLAGIDWSTPKFKVEPQYLREDG